MNITHIAINNGMSIKVEPLHYHSGIGGVDSLSFIDLRMSDKTGVGIGRGSPVGAGNGRGNDYAYSDFKDGFIPMDSGKGNYREWYDQNGKYDIDGNTWYIKERLAYIPPEVVMMRSHG